MAITELRTAAATAVAVKYLAREHRDTVLICGCGAHAPARLRAAASPKSKGMMRTPLCEKTEREPFRYIDGE